MFEVLTIYSFVAQGKDNTRKVRDKFDAVMAATKRDIEQHNQSGRQGERSELFLIVEQAHLDIDERDDEEDVKKREGIEMKRQLEAIEDTALQG